MTTKSEYQVGGKGGRKFPTLEEAVRFEEAKQAQDGIFRNVAKIKTEPFPSILQSAEDQRRNDEQQPAPVQAQHSPLPWKIDEAEDLPLAIIEDTEDGYGICELEFPETEQAKVNAAFIVRACNEYDSLKAHAQGLADALQGWQDWVEGKRAWPKLETNEALAQWEKARNPERDVAADAIEEMKSWEHGNPEGEQ